MINRKIYFLISIINLIFLFGCEVQEGRIIKGTEKRSVVYHGIGRIDDGTDTLRYTFKIEAHTNTDRVHVGETVEILTEVIVENGAFSGSAVEGDPDVEHMITFLGTANVGMDKSDVVFKLKASTDTTFASDGTTVTSENAEKKSGFFVHNIVTPNAVGTFMVTANYQSDSVTVTVPVEGFSTAK